MLIKNKASNINIIGIWYKVRQFLDNNSLHNLYYSYLSPYIIYYIEMGGGMTSACHMHDQHLHFLFLIQKMR